MTVKEIVKKILDSKKYCGIDRVIIERICEETMSKYRKPGDAIKAVKKELHIIHGSFLTGKSHSKAMAMIASYTGKEIKTDKIFAAQLMALHSSTRERLEQADRIYPYLCGFMNADDTIIDIGCGFNPFALPFFTVQPGNYFAFDISHSTVILLGKYFAISNTPYQAEVYDAVMQTAHVQGDVILMLKLFPVLERQKTGSGFSVLNSLNFRNAVVSFPLKSASGKNKGMEAFYSSWFEAELPEKYVIVDKTSFKNEMFYILGILSPKLI